LYAARYMYSLLTLMCGAYVSVCLSVCTCVLLPDYTAGLQVDQAPPPCCKKTGFFSISTKDYTTVIPLEKAGLVAGAALRRMQESGASPAVLAKVSVCMYMYCDLRSAITSC
jgi:hypothetical protein